jgi:hypothetical protein
MIHVRAFGRFGQCQRHSSKIVLGHITLRRKVPSRLTPLLVVISS